MYLQCRTNVAMFHVYYKEKTGMRYRTDIRFGIEDFICNYIFLLFRSLENESDIANCFLLSVN